LVDETVQRNVRELGGEIDRAAFLDAWSRVLDASDYDDAPVWFHGDLSYLNLLVKNGRLCGVIDWGTCGVGDPASDAIVAWSLLTPEARAVYRDALAIDDATWERGKGWVLCGVNGITYYRDTNPILVADKIRAIEAVLAEVS
jgi:aminoglycoside phosphotransferase (APT) family kinase protein